MKSSLLIPFAMIAFALASAAMSLRDELSRYAQRVPYILGVPEAGSEHLRSTVPTGERLGFFSDRSDSEVAGRRMYAAIYSLAPFTVDNTPNRRFVIGDFQDESEIPLSLSREGLHLVADLGNGFWLLASAQ